MFVDRTDAGIQLAEELLWLKDTPTEKNIVNGIIVLAIPRRGVIIGDIIALYLGVRLDLVVSRKIGAPFNPEFAIGAVMPDGTCFLSAGSRAQEALRIPQQYIAAQAEEQMKEINRRLVLYRGRKEYDNELEGKIAILADDGIATGSTIIAAARWIKAQKCKELVIAVPVGPKETIEKLEAIADKVVVLEAPESFESVGEFYQDFNQVEDIEVISVMRKHGYKVPGYSKSLTE